MTTRTIAHFLKSGSAKRRKKKHLDRSNFCRFHFLDVKTSQHAARIPDGFPSYSGAHHDISVFLQPRSLIDAQLNTSPFHRETARSYFWLLPRQHRSFPPPPPPSLHLADALHLYRLLIQRDHCLHCRLGGRPPLTPIMEALHDLTGRAK